MFLFSGLFSQARQLVISQNGEVKYVLQEHQLVNLSLNNGSKLQGILTILSDSTLRVNDVDIHLSNIRGIEVKKKDKVVTGLGIAGLAGGTCLILIGSSLMSQEGIAGILDGIVGVVLVGFGVVVDFIAVTALALSGGKWIYVSGIFSDYQLSIL